MLRLLVFGIFATTAALADEGFVPLSDGQTLDGWVQRGGEAVYTVAPRAPGGPQIVGTSVFGTPNSFLCTERDYANFILELEVKVDPSLNSGVQFRSECFDQPITRQFENSDAKQVERRIAAGRVHGYQAEIDPSPRSWSAGVYDEARRGWLFKLEGPDLTAARHAFDRSGWNHYRIEAVGDSIRTFINGVPAADFTDGMTHSGFIALQVHGIPAKELEGSQVRWRNLRIKEVKP